MSAFLELKNLSKSFLSGQDQREAFSNVSLTVEKGEFLCIVGSSGCGKTTLLRVVGGFEQATGGEVLLEGKPVTAPGPRCAMVFQTFDQLLPWKTVIGNIAYPLQAAQAGGRAGARSRAMEYLEMVGLTRFSEYYPHQLSGGMKQRVAIARALAMRPELILMDEPFASLDAETRTTLQKELKRIWRDSGITVLFVTHSIIESIALSTRLMAMGEHPESVKLLFENPVEGPRGELKTPESPGYAGCWGTLSKAIRK